MLYAEIDGRGPRVVLVHGFTQTRRSWGPVAVDLARDHEVVRVGRRPVMGTPPPAPGPWAAAPTS